MDLLQTGRARPGGDRARRRPAVALLAVLLVLPAGAACAPEVESVPAESVAASESASASASASASESRSARPRAPRRKPTGPASSGADEKAADKAAGTSAGPAAVPVDGGRVTAGPVTFAAPSGWQPFDEQLLRDAAGSTWVRQLAEAMGLTPEQLMASVAATDLMLVSTDGMARGFADNVNVVTLPGPLPGDDELRQQFVAVGATVRSVEHTRTALGETVSLAYDLGVGDVRIAGEVVLAEVAGRTSTVTVSALDRGVTTAVAQRVRDTLAAAP